jgi:hypothetical protein
MDKVERLLRLADSDNAHEAAAALGQANRLMAEHGIEQSMLGADKAEAAEAVINDYTPLDTSRRYVAWKGQLAMTLGKHNACRVWKSGGDLHLVGRPSDVSGVRYLYAYASREIDRLARAHAQGRGRVYANNYRLGCVEGIGAALRAADKAMREHLYQGAHEASQAAGNASALVRLDNALAKRDARQEGTDAFYETLGMRKSRSSRRYYDHGARTAGQRAGRNINMSAGKGLGAGRDKLRGGS